MLDNQPMAPARRRKAAESERLRLRAPRSEGQFVQREAKDQDTAAGRCCRREASPVLRVAVQAAGFNGLSKIKMGKNGKQRRPALPNGKEIADKGHAVSMVVGRIREAFVARD